MRAGSECVGCLLFMCGCGWSGRRKSTDENRVAGCPKCERVGLRAYAVRHRIWNVCALARPRHVYRTCVWCNREMRDDRMKKWDGEWECVNVVSCARTARERRSG